MGVCSEVGQRTASQPMTKCQVHVASSCSAALMLSAACDACARGSGCQRQASGTAYSRHGPAARAGKTIMSYVAITPASFSDFRLWGHTTASRASCHCTALTSRCSLTTCSDVGMISKPQGQG